MLRSKFTIDERIELNRMLNRFLVVMLLLCLSGVALTIKMANDLRNIPVHTPELPQANPNITTVQVKTWPKKEKPEGSRLQTSRLEKL